MPSGDTCVPFFQPIKSRPRQSLLLFLRTPSLEIKVPVKSHVVTNHEPCERWSVPASRPSHASLELIWCLFIQSGNEQAHLRNTLLPQPSISQGKYLFGQ